MRFNFISRPQNSVMKSIAVFFGSATGNDPVHKNNTLELARQFAKNNIQLVYGGGNIGLMGIMADEVLLNNGHVIGVIPAFMTEKELAHSNLTDLIIVDSMHQRKQKMCDLSHAFVILPGGFGTMDEFFEILTWKQLGLHNKPIYILNSNGYYNELLALMDKMFMEGFVAQQNLKLIDIANNVNELIQKITAE